MGGDTIRGYDKIYFKVYLKMLGMVIFKFNFSNRAF